MRDSATSLDRLRRHIARLEGGGASVDSRLFSTGHHGVDEWLGGGLARGRLHELVGGESADAGSLNGFAAMLTIRARRERPLLWLRTQAAEDRAGRLYATGFAELGLAGDSLLLGLLADDAALLRAANDAARCAGLGALVVEAWGNPKPLDLTATRRLMLAAEHSGVTILLLRADARESPSVADTRWRVAAAPSVPLQDGTATGVPGSPVFEIELLRRRAGPSGRRWLVEWNRERRAFQLPEDNAPLPRAVLPVAAH